MGSSCVSAFVIIAVTPSYNCGTELVLGSTRAYCGLEL